MTKTEKLEMLRNRATAYEVVARRGGLTYLVGYTVRRSKRGLLDVIRRNGQDLLRVFAIPGDATMCEAGGGFVIEGRGDPIAVRFSGRTRRDAILGGELIWVGEA